MSTRPLRRSIGSLLIAGMVSLLSTAAAAQSPATDAAGARAPTRIILFISDGTGIGAWTAAQDLSERPLNVSRLPVGGFVDTRADPQLVTDSAAAATAYACGVRTANGVLSMDREGNRLQTILERAESEGLATGLVVTCSVTHATPAAFAAHVPDREMHPEIAEQLAAAGLEVLLGGGKGWFDGSLRPDGRDLYTPLAERYTVVEDSAELADLAGWVPDRLLGLFAPSDMPRFSQRSPGLPLMTRRALEVLDRDPDGFFLMVEGSQADWRAHDNEPIAEVADEVLDLDRAIGEALDYRAEHPEVLIVVTADHETAGMAVVSRRGRPVERYLSKDHTANMVPLFAIGPGAERFGGLHENREVGQLLMELLESGVREKK